MKSVLISIQPKWCELIASGKKTVEIRKTALKDTPFKVYMYCTIGGFINKQRTIPKEPLFRETHFDGIKYTTSIDLADKTLQEYKLANGKVIGEFVCDKLEKYNTSSLDGEDRLYESTCLYDFEIMNYMNDYTDRIFYCWHISEVIIYDEPRELSEFIKQCSIKNHDCHNCEFYSNYSGKCVNRITRPPLSWQFVEEL